VADPEHSSESNGRQRDPTVRVGGDEFVCVLSGATDPVVRDRFTSVKASLAAEEPGGSIKVGIAVLGPDETATQLIGLADSEMQIGPA
jgi:GGDEF domain-containing protein